MTLLRDKISLILAESKRPRADLNLLFREWALEIVGEDFDGSDNPLILDEYTRGVNTVKYELRDKIMEDTT